MAGATRGIDAVLTPLDDGTYDFSLDETGDICTEDAFDTSIIVSLMSDRRADESEVLRAELRRGWIGNESTPGFEIGSKLWLYEQSRLTQSVLNGLADAAKQCLQWMIDDSIPATGTTIANAVQAEAVIQDGSVFLNVTIERPNSQVEKRYYELWDKTPVSQQ